MDELRKAADLHGKLATMIGGLNDAEKALMDWAQQMVIVQNRQVGRLLFVDEALDRLGCPAGIPLQERFAWLEQHVAALRSR